MKVKDYKYQTNWRSSHAERQIHEKTKTKILIMTAITLAPLKKNLVQNSVA